MEKDRTATEEILEYLGDHLEGHPCIDAIISGIFIAKDFTKMHKVVEVIKNARQQMNLYKLK